MEDDLDMRRIASGGLIDAVIDDLPHEMVETLGAGAPDVHAWPFANGIEPLEYTFKCATVNFFCGNEVTGDLCTDGAQSEEKASDEDCKKLIAAVNDPTVDPFSFKCPNNRAISHYVRYDCRGAEPVKCEDNGCSTCKRRLLRGIFG